MKYPVTLVCDGIGVTVEKKTKSYQCTLLFGRSEKAIIDAKSLSVVDRIISPGTLRLLKRARRSLVGKKS